VYLSHTDMFWAAAEAIAQPMTAREVKERMVIEPGLE
jgi:hypothetical protein